MKKLKLISLMMVAIMLISNMGMVFGYDEEYENGIMTIMSNPVSNDSIKVLLNDEMIDFTDENGNVVEPQIIHSRTMVPMRKIFEVFGAEVLWNGETREVTAKTENKTLKLQIDNTLATVTTDGNTEEITLDSAPVILDGRTLVPVRFIAESLNLKVGWDAESRTVIILDKSFILARIEKEAPVFYELLNLEGDSVLTEEATVSGTGNIKYINSTSKSSNTNLKLKLDGKIKVNEKALSSDLTLKTTGSGSLINKVKEAKLEKATMSIVLDKEGMFEYVKSSLLESEIGKKWVAFDLNEYLGEIQFDSISGNITIEDILDGFIDSLELTTNTYYEMNEYVDLICELFGNKYLTVTGRSSKTYTYEITLDDLLRISGRDVSEFFDDAEEIDKLTVTLKLIVKIDNNVATSSSISMDGTIVSGKETINFDFKGDIKVTSRGKNVTITMPNANEIVSSDEIQSSN